jgi:hypothetical protein
MKRILLSLFAVLISIAASAQYASVPHSELEVRGSRIFCDGEKLSKEKAAALFSDFGGVDRGDEYLRYRKGYKTGVGLSVGGASLVVLGGSAFCVSSVLTVVTAPLIAASGQEVPKELEVALSASLGSAALGAVIMLAGIPTASVYQHRIKKMSKDYNALGQKQEPVVSFRPASSGLGIAMTF